MLTIMLNDHANSTSQMSIKDLTKRYNLQSKAQASTAWLVISPYLPNVHDNQQPFICLALIRILLLLTAECCCWLFMLQACCLRCPDWSKMQPACTGRIVYLIATHITTVCHSFVDLVSTIGHNQFLMLGLVMDTCSL